MDGIAAPVPAAPLGHSHVFLGKEHERAERRTWWVIALCGAMMVLEIVGGLLFGSIALVADGLHMSTHAGALLLAALAYSYARRRGSESALFGLHKACGNGRPVRVGLGGGRVFCVGGGEPPRVKLAGAEAVPGPTK